MLKFVLVPLAAAALAASAAPAGAQAFPDGPGKEILEKKCSTCHAPEQVTTFGRSAEEWHEVVVNMIDLGAEGNEEETKVLVEYLTKNWPVKGSPADKPADKPAEEKPTEEKPTEEKPAEEKPAEKPADKPAEKPSEESKPTPQTAPATITPARSH
jgi:hypothetical protein